MGSFTISGDIRLQQTTDTYVGALIDDAVAQSTSSIADWLNTRLAMTEATAKALETTDNDDDARRLFQAISAGGSFLNVYVGRTDDGYMLMKTEKDDATLPADFDPRTRPWYKKAISVGSASFTDPYLDATADRMVLSSLAPVKSGSYKGVVGADISMATIEKILKSVTLADAGYAALINKDGTILFHPNQKLIGKNIKALIGAMPDLKGTVYPFEADGVSWTAGFHKISQAKGVDWYLGIFVNEDKINAPVQNARIFGLILAVSGLLISLVILRFGIRVLMAPVRRLGSAMRDISTGDADLTRRLDASTQDEFGQLAANFNQFVENIQAVVKDVQQGSAELGDNVLSLRNTAKTSRTSVERQQAEIDMVATAINEMSAAAN